LRTLSRLLQDPVCRLITGVGLGKENEILFGSGSDYEILFRLMDCNPTPVNLTGSGNIMRKRISVI
jgi:hypothetical protein